MNFHGGLIGGLIIQMINIQGPIKQLKKLGKASKLFQGSTSGSRNMQWVGDLTPQASERLQVTARIKQPRMMPLSQSNSTKASTSSRPKWKPRNRFAISKETF